MVADTLSDLYQIFLTGFVVGLGVSGAAALIGFTIRRIAGLFK